VSQLDKDDPNVEEQKKAKNMLQTQVKVQIDDKISIPSMKLGHKDKLALIYDKEATVEELKKERMKQRQLEKQRIEKQKLLIE